MKKIFLFLVIFFWFGVVPATAGSGYEYQLYKNSEDFGIVVFPKKNIFAELDEFIKSLIFKKIESGKAVMRYGSKGENETFMMPLEIQKKYSIEKFMVIQVLTQTEVMIGVYDPEWGLTLPSAVFRMEDVKKNIPKTLDVFRGDNPRKEIHWNENRNSGSFRIAGFRHCTGDSENAKLKINFSGGYFPNACL